MKRVTLSEREGQKRVAFACPGCGSTHDLPVAPSNTPHAWGFSGTEESPTLTPSILATSEYDDHGALTDEDYGPWVPDPNVKGASGRDVKPESKHKLRHVRHVCHSFVREGRIQFLTDCTHKLAGQTVELTEVTP